MRQLFPSQGPSSPGGGGHATARSQSSSSFTASKFQDCFFFKSNFGCTFYYGGGEHFNDAQKGEEEEEAGPPPIESIHLRKKTRCSSSRKGTTEPLSYLLTTGVVDLTDFKEQMHHHHHHSRNIDRGSAVQLLRPPFLQRQNFHAALNLNGRVES